MSGAKIPFLRACGVASPPLQASRQSTLRSSALVGTGVSTGLPKPGKTGATTVSVGSIRTRGHFRRTLAIGGGFWNSPPFGRLRFVVDVSGAMTLRDDIEMKATELARSGRHRDCRSIEANSPAWVIPKSMSCSLTRLCGVSWIATAANRDHNASSVKVNSAGGC